VIIDQQRARAAADRAIHHWRSSRQAQHAHLGAQALQPLHNDRGGLFQPQALRGDRWLTQQPAQLIVVAVVAGHDMRGEAIPIHEWLLSFMAIGRSLP
jgi:hypothetical protein